MPNVRAIVVVPSSARAVASQRSSRWYHSRVADSKRPHWPAPLFWLSARFLLMAVAISVAALWLFNRPLSIEEANERREDLRRAEWREDLRKAFQTPQQPLMDRQEFAPRVVPSRQPPSNAK